MVYEVFIRSCRIAFISSNVETLKTLFFFLRAMLPEQT